MPLYNMDNIKESLEKFDKVNEKIAEVVNTVLSSYVKTIPQLEPIVMLYINFPTLDSVGKTIHNRWNHIINHVEEMDNGYSNMVDKGPLLDRYIDSSISELLMIRDGLLDIFPDLSAMYNGIELGGEVGEYNVTKGHDTATWAIDDKNVEDLNAKHVTKESQFMRFAVVNEDGSIGYISNEKGITLEQFCVDNNVPPERVAVDVGSKDGKSQAWVSVKELTDGVASTSAGNNGIKKAVDSSQASGKTTATKTDNSQAAYIFTDEELELSESINAYKAYDNNIKSLQQEKEQCTDQDRINKINYLISENEEGKKRSKRAINSKIDYIDDIESKLYIANEKLRWSPKNNDSYYDDYLNKQEIEKLSTLKLEAEKIINNDNN